MIKRISHEKWKTGAKVVDQTTGQKQSTKSLIPMIAEAEFEVSRSFLNIWFLN